SSFDSPSSRIGAASSFPIYPTIPHIFLLHFAQSTVFFILLYHVHYFIIFRNRCKALFCSFHVRKLHHNTKQQEKSCCFCILTISYRSIKSMEKSSSSSLFCSLFFLLRLDFLDGFVSS